METKFESVNVRLPAELVEQFKERMREEGVKKTTSVIAAMMKRYIDDLEFSKEIGKSVLEAKASEIRIERADKGAKRGSYKERWQNEAIL